MKVAKRRPVLDRNCFQRDTWPEFVLVDEGTRTLLASAYFDLVKDQVE